MQSSAQKQGERERERERKGESDEIYLMTLAIAKTIGDIKMTEYGALVE